MKQFSLFKSFSVIVLACASAATPLVAQPAKTDDVHVLGRRMGSVAIEDLNGQVHVLSELKEPDWIVVAFLGTECPLVRQYTVRLNELAARYADHGQVIGVFSNDQDSAEEIARYVDEMQIAYMVSKDQDNRVADLFSALRTPEVFLLDRERTICYRGRIDDQHGIGYSKVEPTSRDLENAIACLQAGKSVDTAETSAVGCLIGRVQSPSSETNITFASHVAPILQRHCVGCHQPGQIGPMSLVEPTDVLGWAAMIEEVVRTERMPPWHAAEGIGRFVNERRMTDAEKNTITQWLAEGAPVGDRTAIVQPPLRAGGWQLPREPDLVLPVSAQAVDIAPTGEMDYLHFRSDYVFEKETWIQAAQILPGNHAVVHHILAFVDGPNGREAIGELEGIDGYLAGYVPGLTVEPYPTGMAKRIPAGSHLIFQVHYTPIGTPQTDQSQIGLILADPQSIEEEVITTSAIRRQLEIEPGNPAHQVTAFSHLPLDHAVLLGMMPHMHLRGKSFRYELQSADGQTEVLLDVPRYDFHWQTSYRLLEPRKLRSGDRICCVAQFDNSADNLNNPDPTQVVRWGDQTREEMMIGYFDIAVPRQDSDIAPIDFEQFIRWVQTMDRFDPNRNGVAESTEIPPRWADRAARLDVNGDSQVTFAELAAQRQQ